MTNIELHWDYTQHRPRCKPSKPNNKVNQERRTSFFTNLFNCCGKKEPIKRDRQLSVPINMALKQNVEEVFLEDLWRFGIPSSLRKTFWPMKIQNRLGLSKQLYRLNKEHGARLQTRDEAPNEDRPQ
jgi:hypothetical protein